LSNSSGDTARILILVGLALQVLLALAVVFILAIFAGALAVLLGLFCLFMLFLVYKFSYARTADEDYEGAELPTLVLGILAVFIGGVIPGILYIVAWVKLRDASAQPSGSEVLGAVFGPSYSTYGAYVPQGVASQGRRCPSCNRPIESDSPYCKWCGSRIPPATAPWAATATGVDPSQAPLPSYGGAQSTSSLGDHMKVLELQRRAQSYNSQPGDSTDPSRSYEKQSIISQASALRPSLSPDGQMEIDKMLASLK
jgi:hypothetical protein